jgi:hypothetical protein
MPTITIPRADLTSDEVTRALRVGLGPRYHVVPGMRMPQACLFAAEPNQDRDTILVCFGSNRLSNRFFRAQVTLTRPSGQTVIRIRPGGTSSEFPVNAFGLVRKIRQVLASASWPAPLASGNGPEDAADGTCHVTGTLAETSGLESEPAPESRNPSGIA